VLFRSQLQQRRLHVAHSPGVPGSGRRCGRRGGGREWGRDGAGAARGSRGGGGGGRTDGTGRVRRGAGVWRPEHSELLDPNAGRVLESSRARGCQARSYGRARVSARPLGVGGPPRTRGGVRAGGRARFGGARAGGRPRGGRAQVGAGAGVGRGGYVDGRACGGCSNWAGGRVRADGRRAWVDGGRQPCGFCRAARRAARCDRVGAWGPAGRTGRVRPASCRCAGRRVTGDRAVRGGRRPAADAVTPDDPPSPGSCRVGRACAVTDGRARGRRVSGATGSHRVGATRTRRAGRKGAGLGRGGSLRGSRSGPRRNRHRSGACGPEQAVAGGVARRRKQAGHEVDGLAIRGWPVRGCGRLYGPSGPGNPIRHVARCVGAVVGGGMVRPDRHCRPGGSGRTAAVEVPV